MYWLLKTEPDHFSINDLENSPSQATAWEGVRNYQARNWLRDQIQKGDLAFFYHSSCQEPGIAGMVEIVRAGYPDETAFDKNSPYYDPKSTPDNPRWYRVDVKLIEKFNTLIALHELKQQPALQHMTLLKKGNRLSVMPVKKEEFNYILKMR